MSQPAVEHPLRPGVYGVFLPAMLLAEHEGAKWWLDLRRPLNGGWQTESVPLADWLIDFCRAHEMDPLRRPIEIHELTDHFGYGVFYTEEIDDAWTTR